MCAGGMDNEKVKSCLDTADYRRMHPFSGGYSSWIDDKLTLMYLCQSADLKGLIPVHFYQTADGEALPLPDCPADLRKSGAEDVLECLRRFCELVLKQVKGSLGEGFYKAEMRDGAVCLNGGGYSEAEFCEFVRALDGYIVMEYLRPHPEMDKFSAGTANTLRYLVANIHGEPLFLRSFVRYGTKATGFVENYNSGGVLCFVDESGRYGGGNVIDPATSENVRIEHHPDTGAALEGVVPLWGEMRAAAAAFCAHFPQLEYLGFDFVASDKGVKMLEINSLSSLDAVQLECSVFDLPNGRWYRERLDRVNGVV